VCYVFIVVIVVGLVSILIATISSDENPLLFSYSKLSRTCHCHYYCCLFNKDISLFNNGGLLFIIIMVMMMVSSFRGKFRGGEL